MSQLPGLSYPTTDNQVLYHVSRASNMLAEQVLPGWMAAHDRVYHHHTNTDFSYDDLWATLAIYYCAVFVWVIVADMLIARPLTFLAFKLARKPTKDYKKTAWFFLHGMFNTLIVLSSWDEALAVFRAPNEAGFQPAQWWGTHPGSLFGAIAIGAFHLHHFAFYDFSFEDIVHHLVNAGAVVIVGALCPWGRYTALSNFAMCGFPGGANYYALWAAKLGWVGRMPQKRFNRFLNIVVRYPIQILSARSIQIKKKTTIGRHEVASSVFCSETCRQNHSHRSKFTASKRPGSQLVYWP